MILGLDSDAFFIGAGVGICIGAQGIYWFAQWVRCDNCCWTSEKRK